MMLRLSMTAALILALGACGGRQDLQPRADQAAPPVARGATKAATALELMEPTMQARPERNAELLTQSQERTDDAFDLPPDNK